MVAQKQMHFASYYRWLVATERWGFPTRFDAPVLDVGAGDGQFLAQIEAPVKIGLDRFARPSVPFPWLQCSGTRLPLRLVPALVRLDAHNPAGEAGHVFARVAKDGAA